MLTLTGCAAHHYGRGLVLHVDPASSTMTVSHEPIPGFMDAMVMPLNVSGRAMLADVQSGDRVGFRISVRDGRTTVDRLTLLSARPTDRGMTMSPARPSVVPVGQPMADFTLTDHRGAAVALRSFRGKVVVLTFIYTRCPLPDYCPRVVGNLRALAARFKARLGQDLALAAITFDPTHDTPEKLSVYARSHDADGPGWYFLTGSAAEIARVCSLFGIDYWPDQGLITHTMQTAVIGGDGRLAATIEGRDFSGRQLGDLVNWALSLL